MGLFDRLLVLRLRNNVNNVRVCEVEQTSLSNLKS
jgi:hypothetical protein